MRSNVGDKELAYIAGFIDGEGCVTASGNYLSLSLGASNTIKAPLLFIQEILGGSVRGYQSREKTKLGSLIKRQYAWHVGGESAVEALLALLPYLIVKKQEAILGIALTAAKGHDRVNVAVELRLAKL